MLEGCYCLGLVASISLLNEHAFEMHNFGDAIGTILAILMLFFLVLTIVYIAYAAIKLFNIFNAKDLESEDEAKESKYFEMFRMLRMDKKMALFFIVFFMLRRLALVSIVTFSVNHPLVQIFMNVFLSSSALLYAIMVCPYDESLLNIAEITNEVFLIILGYHLCLMTDFVVDLEI